MFFASRFIYTIIVKSATFSEVINMASNPLVLTLDFGTQSVRTALIDKTGSTVYLARKTYEPLYFSNRKGYAEQHAEFYWENLIECLKELCSNNEKILQDIVGMTVTTFRDSAVLLDKNYKPLRPVILWLDQRLAKAEEKLPAFHRFLFKLSGMKNTVDMNRTRTMAHWVKENEPDLWAKVDKYVNISTYIIYKLTGELADSPGGLTGHYPLNYRKKVWYKEGALKGRIYGIPNRMLPKVVQAGDVIGTIKDEVAELVGLPKGLKLTATGSDKGCETIGLGCLTPDVGAISYGTACTIEVSNPKYHEPEPFLPAYAAAVPNLYNMDVQIYRGYWMLKWFAGEFASELEQQARLRDVAVEEILDEWLYDVTPGSDGLILQPYWGPGLERPLAKGAIVGFSNVQTRKHIYRAIVEGIAFALREGLESIEKSQKHKVKSLRISGGGSLSDEVCQITADIFGLEISRVQTIESTSLGAAIATFTAVKEFKDIHEAAKNMTKLSKTFKPNKENHLLYDKIYHNVYLNMYPRLKPLNDTINDLFKR